MTYNWRDEDVQRVSDALRFERQQNATDKTARFQRILAATYEDFKDKFWKKERHGTVVLAEGERRKSGLDGTGRTRVDGREKFKRRDARVAGSGCHPKP